MKTLEIQHISPANLRANSFNTNVVSPENEQKIDASLDRFGGFFKPILCRELADGTLEIIGGEHRWASAKRKKFATVPVINLGPLEDNRAIEIGLVDNGRYGEDDALQLGELLKGLGDIDDLAGFLPYTGAEFDSMFAASDISLDDLSLDDGADSLPDLGSGAALQTTQVMRFKVPMDDSDYVQRLIEKTMKDQGFTSEDSLSNAGNALVHLLRSL
jgi:hypothetical protein